MNIFMFNIGAGRINPNEGLSLSFSLMAKEMTLGISTIVISAASKGCANTKVTHLLPPELRDNVTVYASGQFMDDEGVLVFSNLEVKVQLLNESLVPALTLAIVVPQPAN